MSAINRLSVSTKLWGATALLICLLMALLVGSAQQAARLEREAQARQAQLTEKALLAVRWTGMVEANVVRVQASMLSSDLAIEHLYREDIRRAEQAISDLNTRIAAMPRQDAEREVAERLAQRQAAAEASMARAREWLDAGNETQALQEITGTLNPAIPPLLEDLRAYASLQLALIADSDAAFVAERQRSHRVAQAQLAALLLVLVAGAAVLVRHIRRPLQDAVGIAQRIAAGDLQADIATVRRDEFGAMILSLADMSERLRDVVAGVRRGTDQIAVASREIAAGNQDLSQRTEQTASQLEQAAARMETVDAGLRQTAGAAERAGQLAVLAGEQAAQGGQAVREVVRTMEDIHHSSHRIGDIIGVIDDIAFQTNILALNAAVEAARAGEQGRGFAVVAGEVRALARRSADAAREIKALIGDSLSRAEAGAAQVQRAGQVVAGVVERVVQVRDIVQDIARSAAAQSQGLADVHASVAQLDRMTQQNAALVEQGAAAAHSLHEQAAALSQAVAVFRLAPPPVKRIPTMNTLLAHHT